jgi:hypothetical protein
MSAAWYTNFPTPKSNPRSITDHDVATLIVDPNKKAGRDYIVVDVRRTDFEVFLESYCGLTYRTIWSERL